MDSTGSRVKQPGMRGTKRKEILTQTTFNHERNYRGYKQTII